MSTSDQTLQLKIEQNCIVHKRSVRVSDIAKMECPNNAILRQVGQMEVYHFTGNDKNSAVKVFSLLHVIELIHGKYPALEIVNLGETDFVIRYVPDPEKKWVQYLKVAVLSIILFFGAAFSIMTFIQDVAVSEMFDRFYFRLTGRTPVGVSPLEVSFCIGLAVGIMVFYNHVGRKKLSDDPTPIQVAMRKYEQDVDMVYIETSGRKGKTIDADG